MPCYEHLQSELSSSQEAKAVAYCSGSREARPARQTSCPWVRRLGMLQYVMVPGPCRYIRVLDSQTSRNLRGSKSFFESPGPGRGVLIDALRRWQLGKAPSRRQLGCHERAKLISKTRPEKHTKHCVLGKHLLNPLRFAK